MPVGSSSTVGNFCSFSGPISNSTVLSLCRRSVISALYLPWGSTKSSWPKTFVKSGLPSSIELAGIR